MFIFLFAYSFAWGIISTAEIRYETRLPSFQCRHFFVITPILAKKHVLGTKVAEMLSSCRVEVFSRDLFAGLVASRCLTERVRLFC